MSFQTLEGIWEDILRQGPDLSGKRVRLTVLDDVEVLVQEPQPDSGESLDLVLAGRLGRLNLGEGNLSERVRETYGEILADKHSRRSPP